MPDRTENEKTILGIDSDKNGIRDDVDIWINRTGKNYNERMALRQLARAEQFKLDVCSQKNYSLSTKACQQEMSSITCLNFNSKFETKYIFKILEAFFENTSKRNKCMKFYLEAVCSVSTNYSLKFKNCDFEVK